MTWVKQIFGLLLLFGILYIADTSDVFKEGYVPLRDLVGHYFIVVGLVSAWLTNSLSPIVVSGYIALLIYIN